MRLDSRRKVLPLYALALFAALAVAGCGLTDDDSAARARPGLDASNADDPHEPYPFEPPPPAGSTEIDGTYERRITVKEAGGPGHCRRCPPYRLGPGTDVLEFGRGIFRITNEDSGFNAIGHFRLEGDRIVLSNDPFCPRTHGEYQWTLSDGSLTFSPIQDECAFGGVRVRYFTVLPWEEGTG